MHGLAGNTVASQSACMQVNVQMRRDSWHECLIYFIQSRITSEITEYTNGIDQTLSIFSFCVSLPLNFDQASI